jgi:pimeloyl-ACP methyl ester carboxylesterase
MNITFPVGYHKLHPSKIVDYQLNRWHSLGYCSLSDMREAAERIKSLDDWKDVMLSLAEKALRENRLMNGTFLIRAAEFFTRPSDPDKYPIYLRFKDLFYNQLIKDEIDQNLVERHKVPYADKTLPALKMVHRTENVRGTLVMHGGFDSFIEEFYSIGQFFTENGYDVVAFEGPGQGAALKEAGLALTYEWEKPAIAVLDYFRLEDVTWLGISMGGWMCFRAAAFEPRISRVIALSIAYDYMEIPPKPVADFARWLMGKPALFGPLTELKMKLRAQEKWGIDNLIYITRSKDALEASAGMLAFNKTNQKSDQVTQDVLILTGEADHFIPLKMHHLQVQALKNARSVTERIFTVEDQAENHCQVGNIGLALNVMLDWMQKVNERQAIGQTAFA